MTDAPAVLAAYRLAVGLIEPFAPVVLRARARRGKEDPARIGERLGHASKARPAGRLVWLHGASIGESLSLLPLAEDIAATRPEASLLITAGTRTAAELLAQRLPAGAIHQYVPIDAPGPVARFFDHWRPDLGVFVESELWPNLLFGARSRGVRLALLSAKLSDRSLRGWSRFPAAASVLLGGFELVLAQDAQASERLARLGARVSGLADLKFGAAPLPADHAALARLGGQIRGRPVVLAASTHPGEDEAILSRFATIARAPSNPLLVVVPRHPERGQAIAAVAAAGGFTVSLQSKSPSIGGAQVRIADALGELGLWYRLASLALVGGSWVEGVGGHNPLEPARLGCPFVSGPHVANWKSAYAGLVAERATELVAIDHIEGWLAAALARDPRLPAMAERAKAFVVARDAEARAITARVLALLA